RRPLLQGGPNGRSVREMVDYFESPKRKLVRAKQDVQDLEREENRFIDEHPWTHVCEIDPDGLFKEFKLRLTRGFTDVFGKITSSAVHNLRDTLDHAGNAAARAAGI